MSVCGDRWEWCWHCCRQRGEVLWQRRSVWHAVGDGDRWCGDSWWRGVAGLECSSGITCGRWGGRHDGRPNLESRRGAWNLYLYNQWLGQVNGFQRMCWSYYIGEQPQTVDGSTDPLFSWISVIKGPATRPVGLITYLALVWDPGGTGRLLTWLSPFQSALAITWKVRVSLLDAVSNPDWISTPL